MSRFHLIFGVLMFIVFVTTGKFMRLDFPDKEAIPQESKKTGGSASKREA